MQRIMYIWRYYNLNFGRRCYRRLTRRCRWRIIARRCIRCILMLQRIQIQWIRYITAQQEFCGRHKGDLFAQSLLGQKEFRTTATIVHCIRCLRRCRRRCCAVRYDAAVATERTCVFITLRILDCAAASAAAAAAADANADAIATGDQAACMIRIVAGAQHVMMVASAGRGRESERERESVKR